MQSAMNLAQQRNFWTMVRVNSDSGCWEWQGFVNASGYGLFRVGAKKSRAHRVCWTLIHSEPAAEQCVLHRCDNRRCVRPEHLFLGSRPDNTADMCAKKRQASGERNGVAKLTADAVKEIRSSDAPRKAIAQQYNISVRHVFTLRAGRLWRQQ